MERRPMIEQVALLSLHSSPLASIGTAQAGGMNVYVRRLADDLSAMGIEVDVFTRSDNPNLPPFTELESGVRVVHLEGGPKRPLSKSLVPLHVPALTQAMVTFAKDNNRRYDIIHSHYWISGLAGVRYGTLTETPVVHMFHTLSKVKEAHFGRCDEQDSELRADAERCLIERTDAVVGATEGEQIDMADLYGKRPRSYACIPPGVDTSLFRNFDRGLSRQRLGIEARRVILFVGRLDPIKRVDMLIAAVSEMDNDLKAETKLIIVGDHRSDGDDHLNEYKVQVRDLGLSDQVDFRGIVSQEELPFYYSAADICAIPSAYESFGMVALESMACRTPVVAFRVGGLATTIKDGRTGFLVDEHTSGALSQTLNLALRAENLTTLGRQARLWVQRYDWSCIATRTREFYEQTAETRLFSYARASGGC